MEILFSKYDNYEVQQHQLKLLKDEISNLSQRQLLAESTQVLASAIASKFVVNVPVLKHAEIYADDKEIQLDARNIPNRMAYLLNDGRPVPIAGTEIQIYVPFEGDQLVFEIASNTFGGGLPRAEILEEHLILRHQFVEHNAESLRLSIDADIAKIESKLKELESIFAPFNVSLKQSALREIQDRISKIHRDKQLLNGLGFPVRRDPNASETYIAPEVQRKLAPREKSITKDNGKILEPVLDYQEFLHIISVCRNMYQVIERSPHAFSAMGEEDLRTHFLVQLNGQYQGQATGETFNFQGKTDILIRIDGKNIFVAECKFWKGEKGFKETLDQLLSYACWRDSRLSLIIFSRNEDFSQVLAKIPEAATSHSNFVSAVSENPAEAEFSYKFKSANDPHITHHVTVMAFNMKLPSKKDPI